MRNLDRRLLAYLLPRLLASACPSTVPRSGEAGQQVDCFTTTTWQGGRRELVLLRLRGGTVDCLKSDGDRCSIETSVPIEDIDPRQLRVTHFYGLDDVQYQGIWSVAWGLFTRWPYVWFHHQRTTRALVQRVFNRRTLEVRRRLDILREVVEASVAGGDAVDAMDLMNRRYDFLWVDHPNWESHHRVLEQHLELLAESGDLKKVEYRYRPTGQALQTLEESEEADRKHSANLRVQLLLAVLTFVSAVMAAAQAGLLKLPTLVDLRDRATVAAEADRARASPSPTAAPSAPTTGR